jgi:photosystem II stability/assembly factor-like uncharacterized protein
MSKMKIFYCLLYIGLFMATNTLWSQNLPKIVAEKKGVSFRGLSIPNKEVIWVSGSKGQVAKSIDGGKNFEFMTIENHENNDFRAIHAWNAQEAIVVSIASPGYVLKTNDGGQHWKTIIEIPDSLVFMDAIHFVDSSNGYIIGDPNAGVPFMLQTTDKGEHFNEVGDTYFKSKMLEGESFFAASNSNITSSSMGLYWVTGGQHSRLWINGQAMDIPIIQGGKTTGANSIAIDQNGKILYIVGGDFSKDSISTKNCFAIQYTGNNQWKEYKILKKPTGYKSSICFVGNSAVTTGTSGVDISLDKGKNWKNITKLGFHVVQAIPNTKSFILAGSGGRIAKLTLD